MRRNPAQWLRLQHLMLQALDKITVGMIRLRSAALTSAMNIYIQTLSPQFYHVKA